MQQPAICVIVKNECVDITEWASHHVGISADRLIIYDDGSDDVTYEHLQDFAQHFPIDLIAWKTDENNRQIAAYKNCLNKFGSKFKWLRFSNE